MVRDVRGNGTLVPEVTRWVPAPADGRVEKILLQAGVEVDPSTVIVELSNPQLEQQAIDAEFQVKAAEADRREPESPPRERVDDAEGGDCHHQRAVQPGKVATGRGRSAGEDRDWSPSSC